MKRHFAALTIAACALLGLTACASGTDTAAAEKTAPASTRAAAPESAAPEAAAPQGVTEACVSMVKPMADSAAALSKIASTTKGDAQDAVKAWTTLSDAYTAAADAVNNEKVKAAATDVADASRSFGEAVKKVLVDGDTGALSDMTDATTRVQKASQALSELCAS